MLNLQTLMRLVYTQPTVIAYFFPLRTSLRVKALCIESVAMTDDVGWVEVATARLLVHSATVTVAYAFDRHALE